MPVVRKGYCIYLIMDTHTYVYDERSPLLGEGSMGIVYRGHELKTGKLVAIKRVRDKFANIPDIRRRAHLEASLMFSHPNLVEMLGCCEYSSQSGPIFIVSGYIEGDTIGSFIEREVKMLPNSEHRICNMFVSVLDALSYIHQKGFLHLDIKPSNIMVEKGRNVRLMDLGIADISNHSVAVGMMGTPKYAAPEQFASKDNQPKLEPSTDIYEAGVTLYELITNKNPFSTPTSIEESKKLHQTTVLPGSSAISPGVLNVVRKATAINPKMRYQSANEMKIALLQALQNPIPKTYNWVVVSLCVAIFFFLAIVILLVS